jgi:hypothetical protein
MKWITRERPKIDRLACPWLIRKMVDPEAEFIYVPKDRVISDAEKLNAVPYDIPGVEYTHYGAECTFDFIVKKHSIKDPAIIKIAGIVRAADTDQFQQSPESAGLWAISAGLSHNVQDDQELLSIGFKIYEGLYSWAKWLQQEKHVWSNAR